MEIRHPTDTELFVALLALLERHEVPSAGRIASCQRLWSGGNPVYCVKSSEHARAAVAHALADFFNRPMSEAYGLWPLSLEDAQRVVEWHAAHRVHQLRGVPESPKNH